MLTKLSNSMSSLSAQLGSLATNFSLPDDVDGALSAAGVGAQIINKQRGELQIHTREGDVVTLQFSSKTGITLQSQQLDDGEATVTDTSIDLRSRSRIAVSVAGDLNEAELAAINDLVGKVGALTGDFINGDMDSILSTAMGMTYDTSQLADYSLDLSLKQSINIYAYGVQLLPPSATSVEPGRVTEAAPDVSASNGADATSVIDAVTPTVVDPVEAAAEVPAATVAGDSPATAGGTLTLAEFVSSVRSAFSMTTGDASLGFSHEFKIKLLVASIAETAPVETSSNADVMNYLADHLLASTV